MSEKEDKIEVQGIPFSLKGTKPVGRDQFIKTWEDMKVPKKDGDGNDIPVRGLFKRFDPEKAWDTMFPSETPSPTPATNTGKGNRNK